MSDDKITESCERCRAETAEILSAGPGPTRLLCKSCHVIDRGERAKEKQRGRVPYDEREAKPFRRSPLAVRQSPPPPSCGGCFYFRLDPDPFRDDPFDRTEGACKRSPPALCEGGKTGDWLLSTQPTVDARDDWCGEFRAKH